MLFHTLCLLVAVAFHAFAQDCGSDDCDLPCNERGRCCFGNLEISKNFTNLDGTPFATHEQTDIQGMYCDCDDGWTGVDCKHSFIFCDIDRNACLNGGICAEGTEDATNEIVHLCDCRNSSDSSGTKYVGLYCEQAVPKMSQDDPNDGTIVCNEDGSQFCLNGGECGVFDEDQYEDPSQTACTCVDAYTGLHCEILVNPEMACTRDCGNGECTFGFRNMTQPEELCELEDEQINSNYQHCQCSNGFAGPHCEIPYQACELNPSDEPVHCFNGGFCVSPTDENGFEGPACDCSSARNLTHSFSGQFCTMPSSEICPPPPNGEASHFCVNGVCVEENFGIYGCNCTKDFTGDHCELKIMEDIPIPLKTCETICDNNGTCREGAKDFGILDDVNGVDHLFNETSNENFEHCVCPEDYTGLHCEFLVEVCPNGTHFCFYGSECVADGDDWQCDCNASEVLAAGPYCQHLATNTCTSEPGAVPFCVNDGVCQSKGDCLCPDGFRGEQCELEESSDDDQFPTAEEVLPDSYESSNSGKVILSTAIVSSVAIIIIIVAVMVTSSREVRSPIESNTSAQHAPPQTAFSHGGDSSTATDHQPDFTPGVAEPQLENGDKPEII